MNKNSKQKIWQIKPRLTTDFSERFPELNNIVKQLLFTRGLDSQEKVDEFLYPDYSQDLFNPFLFKDMSKACERIWQAVEKKELILVYGDYDADGVCATTVIMDFFKLVGARSEVYIPHRELEGYGLNQSAVQEFIAKKINLLITVDCGTTNFAEVATLQAAGVDVVITDHHHVPTERVQPLAFLNCADTNDSYPFSFLSGTGMAFKLVQGLIDYGREKKLSTVITPGWEKWLLDLVAIATITDIMPLKSENHTLVKYGLKVLAKTRRVGLQKLITLANIKPTKIDNWQIGFIIGPRLNAAGRIDHANQAYALLNETDDTLAENLATKLQTANTKRQILTEQYLKEAKEQVEPQFLKGDKILTAYQTNWDLGLVGLVAGRLTEFYRRPSLVMTLNQDKVMGSGRSLAGFSIIAAVTEQSKYLSRYGGHEGACGFTLQSPAELDNFCQSIKLAASEVDVEIFQPVLAIDAVVKLSEVDWSLLLELEKFTPFGEDNPAPRFATFGLQVLGVDFAGEENKHLRLVVGDEEGLVRKTIGFGLGKEWGSLQMGDLVDIVYEVGSNEWNNQRELQLKIIDLQIHEKN